RGAGCLLDRGPGTGEDGRDGEGKQVIGLCGVLVDSWSAIRKDNGNGIGKGECCTRVILQDPPTRPDSGHDPPTLLLIPPFPIVYCCPKPANRDLPPHP